MFFRCLDSNHPANRGKETVKYQKVIEDLYVRMDGLISRVLGLLDSRTVVLVISDHGFTQFKRGVNLNAWFHQNGYLALKDGTRTSGDWFKDVDWERFKGNDPRFLLISGRRIPYAVFDNMPEKTDRPDILGAHLEDALNRLWSGRQEMNR
jgi:predicted AlkP superfamily phosphohydrolase/phosphomutase